MLRELRLHLYPELGTVGCGKEGLVREGFLEEVEHQAAG